MSCSALRSLAMNTNRVFFLFRNRNRFYLLEHTLPPIVIFVLNQQSLRLCVVRHCIRWPTTMTWLLFLLGTTMFFRPLNIFCLLCFSTIQHYEIQYSTNSVILSTVSQNKILAKICSILPYHHKIERYQCLLWSSFFVTLWPNFCHRDYVPP